MSIFPEDFYNNKISNKKEKEVPILRDYAINLDTGEILFGEDGKGIIVEKEDAILVQAWRKLHTYQGRFIIYSPKYGERLEDLYGKGKRIGDLYVYDMVYEALVDNVYVKNINNLTTELKHDKYIISFKLDTIYGILDYYEEIYLE